MTLDEIKAAVAQGKTVRWKNAAYIVTRDGNGRHYIECEHNGHAIGLAWTDEATMNGKPEDFYIEDQP
jgi:hypothetical protein